MKTQSPTLLAIIPLALAAGCTQPDKVAKPTPDYFADARECGQKSQTKINIPINLGALGTRYGNANVGIGPANITMPIGTDQTQYRFCMEKQGWKPDPAKDPFFALLETCRQAAKVSPTANAEEGTKIGADFDTAIYQECLQNNGVTGTVTILPIRPAKPPE